MCGLSLFLGATALIITRLSLAPALIVVGIDALILVVIALRLNMHRTRP